MIRFAWIERGAVLLRAQAFSYAMTNTDIFYASIFVTYKKKPLPHLGATSLVSAATKAPLLLPSRSCHGVWEIGIRLLDYFPPFSLSPQLFRDTLPKPFFCSPPRGFLGDGSAAFALTESDKGTAPATTQDSL